MPVISPGGELGPDRIVNVNAAAPRFSRSSIVKGQNQVFRPYRPASGGNAYFDVELIGWRTLIEDFETASEMIVVIAYQVTRISGELVRDTAMYRVPVDTGLTKNSMANDPWMQIYEDDFIASMGPTTFYAPWLEFGTSKMSARPFMIPASDAHQVDFVNAMIDGMGIVMGETGHIRTADEALREYISVTRKKLYTTQKAMGDVMALGIARGPLATARTGILSVARLLGDVSAAVGGTTGQRVSRRITGRVTGRAIGLSRTVAANQHYSVFPGGTAGTRVYNRFVGRQTTGFTMSAGGLFG